MTIVKKRWANNESCSMSIKPIVTKFHNSSPREKQCYSCVYALVSGKPCTPIPGE